MAYLSKSDILGAKDLDTEDVEVPEWGGTVKVRGLSGQERDSFEMRMAAAHKAGTTAEQEIRANLAAKCMVDEEGKRLFTDKEISQLGKKSAAVLDRVSEKVQELSGMKQQATKEAAEDFGGAAGEDSPSA